MAAWMVSLLEDRPVAWLAAWLTVAKNVGKLVAKLESSPVMIYP